jgi:hypothetical protein
MNLRRLTTEDWAEIVSQIPCVRCGASGFICAVCKRAWVQHDCGTWSAEICPDCKGTGHKPLEEESEMERARR